MTYQSQRSYRDYNTGHPWYYLLGGPVRTLKQIKADTAYSGYKGYRRDEITKADAKPEPQRSASLRKIRVSVVEELRADIVRYRHLAVALHRWRKANPNSGTGNTVQSCDDIYTNISLKHNHLVNGFAHLITIDNLLHQQGDLFAV